VAADPKLSLVQHLAVSELSEELGLSPEVAQRVQELLAAGDAVAAAVLNLREQGIRAISPFDEAYPLRLKDRLGTTAPPVLYLVGDEKILAEGGIGVVGSRNVSAAGADVAGSVAEAAARRQVAVISGFAKGVDQVAMERCISSGGRAVGVLSEGLASKLRRSAVQRDLEAGVLCLLSPYIPDARFSVANAMARNKVVYGLADATMVVAADMGRGGTWEGAMEALRRSFGKVGVWMGEGAGDGNESLAAQERARRIDEIDGIFVLATEEEEPRQLGLGL
jgi:predicted Rossmann fold nucleotide-binding protein DprA/Smf involved in DNA uptake